VIRDLTNRLVVDEANPPSAAYKYFTQYQVEIFYPD
jgi:hypothetical protein